MVFFMSASASGKFRIDHHSKNLETTMLWYSLKFNRALKSHPNVKVPESKYNV